MKEQTSAGLLGIHFGYIKVCAQKKLLANFEATIYHIPYSIGYSPEDQQIAMNTMIKKKGKGNQVGNLRTINLIEANFNFNNK